MRDVSRRIRLGGDGDWLVTATKWGVKAVVAGEVAARTGNFTWVGALDVALTEVLSANEASEIMVGMAVRSAMETTAYSALPGTVAAVGVNAELYYYDRAVTSLTNDVYTVLSRSR